MCKNGTPGCTSMIDDEHACATAPAHTVVAARTTTRYTVQTPREGKAPTFRTIYLSDDGAFCAACGSRACAHIDAVWAYRASQPAREVTA